MYERGGSMNFNIFRIYVHVCRLINSEPSFQGLRLFMKFYKRERGANG